MCSPLGLLNDIAHCCARHAMQWWFDPSRRLGHDSVGLSTAVLDRVEVVDHAREACRLR